MDNDGCDSSEVWNIFLEDSLFNMFLSAYHWNYLQVGLCDVTQCLFSVVYCYLD